MTSSIGIVDEPVKPGAKDNLDISIHSKSLVDFITNTGTPLTVGIQGEWGSGKTSLINTIHFAFEKQDSVKQIWINSWEYSLLSTPEEALLKIVNKIIDELLESDTDVKRKAAIKEGAGKIFKGALRVGAQVALGTEAGKVARELLDSSNQSISELRQQLTNVINDINERPTNPYKRIIVYVDDLDRIEPKNAVAILELLKNIFSVPNCVFILAIDYQVVVKGLEHKFGKQTPENEWEFRAFFDKIIQLPFMMPMGQYNIGKYVNSLLSGIGFVDEDGLNEQVLRDIIMRSIGGNPRSIKRLVNSISLIQIFVKNKKELDSQNLVDEKEESSNITAEDEKLLLFSLLCLQIAFPPIYSLLVNEPNFTKWDDDFAFKQTNRSEERMGDNNRLSPDEMKKIFEAEFEIVSKGESFDESWEQALYRMCYVRPRLKPRAEDISILLNLIKDEIFSNNEGIIGQTFSRLLSQTSVTSVSSTDQGQVEEGERFKRVMYDGIETWEAQQFMAYSGKKVPDYLRKSIEAVKFLHDHTIEKFSDTGNFEMKYSRTGGCTGYITSDKEKKFLQINFFGRDGHLEMRFLKDFEHDHKVPLVPSLNTCHVRNYNPVPGHESTAAFGEYYCVQGSLENFKEQIDIIDLFIKRSCEIAELYPDKILNILGRAQMTKIDVSERKPIIDKQIKLLDPNYTYQL